ncbi:MAG: tail fiber domain-containing protein [Xanthomonadales bacterium]|nr:tail fiber domain-containing protein [Xanthomonadales bacterium]
MNDGGKPANGEYDLRLTLLNEAGTASVSQPITLYNVPVRDGNFSAEVEFGIDLSLAPALKLKTEVGQNNSGFSSLSESTRFDPKAALAGICWDTTGNVVAAGEFLGSTNNQPLVLRSNNQSVLQLTGGLSNGAANILAGSPSNTLNNGTIGQTVSGGGDTRTNCGASSTASCRNSTGDQFATVSGGVGNNAVGIGATIGGGVSNTTNGDRNVISGGLKNQTSSFDSTVAGGSSNVATGSSSAVAGGYTNSATGSSSNVSGGSSNISAGDYSHVSGGSQNQASGLYSAIGGGRLSQAAGDKSTIGGGGTNTASGQLSTVSGGEMNIASGDSSVVSGGASSIASGHNSTVAGGGLNIASGAVSAVGGGQSNTAAGNSSTVSGGIGNCAGGDYSWAGGSYAFTRPGNDPGDSTCAPNSGNPEGDIGTFVWADTVGGDFTSTGPSQFLVRAQGGMGLNTARLGQAANLRSSELVIRNGAVGDNTDITLMNGTDRGYNMVSVPNGVNAGTFAIGEVDARTASVVFTNRLLISPNGDLTVSAGAFKPGGGAWSVASDARLKKDVSTLQGSLDRLLALHGVNFSYRDDAPTSLAAPGAQIGFIAQEVEKVFPQWIAERDGFKTIGIRGFEALTVEALRDLRSESAVIDAAQSAELEKLRAENAALQARLDRLEAMIAR